MTQAAAIGDEALTPLISSTRGQGAGGPEKRGRLAIGLDYWRSALVYSAVLLTPVIAYVGNLAFAPMAALLGMGAVVFLGRKSAPSVGVAILLGLLLWALVSMTWSPALALHPDFHRYKSVESLTAMKLVFELTFYTAFAMAMRQVSDKTASRASLILAAGLAAVMVLVMIESLDGAVLYQWIKKAVHQKTRPDLAARNVARACYVGTVLFWPLALRLRRAAWPLVLAAYVVGLCAAAVIFKVDSPILALILASLIFGAVKLFGRRVLWALVAAVVVYFAAAPLVAYQATHILQSHVMPGSIAKQSWAVRLDIWRFASAEILQNPVRGWGIDASRAWPQQIPLHPHDAALQLWLELGAAGAALGALFWAWLFVRIGDMVESDRHMGAAAAATAVAYLTIGALSFGVWQEWWLAVGAVAIVTCGLVASSRRLDDSLGHDFTLLQPIS